MNPGENIDGGIYGPAALRESLRRKVDTVHTNYDGDRMWLGPSLNAEGKRVGITDCCYVDHECERHRTIIRRANWEVALDDAAIETADVVTNLIALVADAQD